MTEIEQLLTRVAVQARDFRPWGWPSLPAPVDAATLDRARDALGFPLPPLLAALYEQVGDGGFGPSYGLLPLLDAAPSGEPAVVAYGLLPLLDAAPSGEPAVVAQYLTHRAYGRKNPEWPWPEGVLPISHWGCGMYACVDCRTPQATVLLYEPNADGADGAWFVDAPTLTDWLRVWLAGTGWYEETDEGTDLAPWHDFRIRTAPEQAC